MANIKIKLGNLELACEGEETFLKTEIPNFLKTVSEFYKQASREIVSAPLPTQDRMSGNGNRHSDFDLSVNTIATRLNASSGSDLTFAACISLGVSKKMLTFSRDQILTEMKAAANFYKDSYRGNLSKQLGTLISDNKVIERSEGQFALSSQTITEIEARLASN
jgi:hypothetical protein